MTDSTTSKDYIYIKSRRSGLTTMNKMYQALKTIAEYPIEDPHNQPAHNMRSIARESFSDAVLSTAPSAKQSRKFLRKTETSGMWVGVSMEELRVGDIVKVINLSDVTDDYDDEVVSSDGTSWFRVSAPAHVDLIPFNPFRQTDE